jgi:hypothetical protein
MGFPPVPYIVLSRVVLHQCGSLVPLLSQKERGNARVTGLEGTLRKRLNLLSCVGANALSWESLRFLLPRRPHSRLGGREVDGGHGSSQGRGGPGATARRMAEHGEAGRPNVGT